MGDDITEFTSADVSFSWRRVVLGVLLGGVVLVLVFGSLYFWQQTYLDRVIPGVRVAGVSVSGLTRGELTGWVRGVNDRLASEGLNFAFTTPEGQKHFVIYPSNRSETGEEDLVRMDVSHEVERILEYGKGANEWQNVLSMLRSRLSTIDLDFETVTLEPEKIHEAIVPEIAPYESVSTSSNIHFLDLSTGEFVLTTSSPGVMFSDSVAMKEIQSAWKKGITSRIVLPAVVQQPIIAETDLLPFMSTIPRLTTLGPLHVAYVDPVTAVPESWLVSPNSIASWVEVRRDSTGAVYVGLDRDLVVAWLEKTIAPGVTVLAQDARFQVDKNGKVTEFQGSRTGQSLDTEATWLALDAAVHARLVDTGIVASTTIQAVVTTALPDISTGAVNNLGITDVLGTGVSRFAGSPANRIKNIKNGVKKINGILIKPGEEFSTIRNTQPFTIDGGYLPELAIIGNRVEPAMGGGLCQISTTLFRMAMNSGMEITERHNHSLMVAYYNDLINNMPGTDATIFEPSPDFKFKNDTGNYVLVQAEMDEKKSELRFTLWGTSDGRKASYSLPVVKRWIPYGETRVTETASLAPGVRRCQHAYQGAEASFTYTRTLASGETVDRVFTSYYRPLPEICLVGAAATASTTSGIVAPLTPTPDSGTPVVLPD